MSPQFVDFDHDGKLDIVAGIFDGSPHVAFASEQGWKQPEQILDREGQRILLNQFWNFDTKKWEQTNRCDPKDHALPKGQCTSAFAWDIDDDGDLDLLLGDYKGGNLYLRRNDGTRGKPAFAVVNEPVLLGKVPLGVPNKMATPRLFDWNGDGLLDLVIGSMGDSHGEGAGGAVYLYRNSGKKGAPVWAEPVTLVAPSAKGHVSGPVRPDAGLYMDTGDVDGDGDLDLMVGGYSMWTPEPPVLTEEQKDRLEVLRRKLKEVTAETKAILDAVNQQVVGLAEEAADARRSELLELRAAELSEIGKRQQAITTEMDPLTPGQKRFSYVWLYENLQATPKAKPTGNH